MGKLKFMSLDEFNKKIHNLDSGIYLITDHNDKIVYVGKAYKIKTRVNAHFKGYSNTRDHAHLFNKVAFILEDSPLKRSLLEITYMIEHKTVLNKEVQEEFPVLYTKYIKQTNQKRKSVTIPLDVDEAWEQAEIENVVRDIENGKKREIEKQRIEKEEQRRFENEVKELQKKRNRERDKLKKDLIKIAGGKSMFYEILSLLESGYNPNLLADALKIELATINLFKENRKSFHIPRDHKRLIKHQDIMYSLSGKKNTGNSRLNHLL
ncbi:MULTISPECIES: GIY-YIG nuclease family protein [Bacillus cereus group]|nr:MULTISPECIES: GIY-YIG nuclease family protein [Bacillus cereus group]MDA1985941.1 GIY-YIG nuclease family protein [Bacillus cereus group sp. Bcc13]MDG0918365.1 GIY-YIG nuclease family protein [Bacillus paranthracis]MDG0927816.1 GIY-YIG nuclease family protein [Bacillus paranthracis]MDG0937444.1 GIY-YIG nuclease family protein [Bacillus paranthracis]MDG0944540.1 GIY-YIG nuclease family protein [Bacillus paranthracis]